MAVGAGLAAGLPYFAVGAITALLFGMYMNGIYSEYDWSLVMCINKQ